MRQTPKHRNCLVHGRMWLAVRRVRYMSRLTTSIRSLFFGFSGAEKCMSYFRTHMQSLTWLCISFFSPLSAAGSASRRGEAGSPPRRKGGLSFFPSLIFLTAHCVARSDLRCLIPTSSGTLPRQVKSMSPRQTLGECPQFLGGLLNKSHLFRNHRKIVNFL